MTLYINNTATAFADYEMYRALDEVSQTTNISFDRVCKIFEGFVDNCHKHGMSWRINSMQKAGIEYMLRLANTGLFSDKLGAYNLEEKLRYFVYAKSGNY
jgi:hypothetical protein